MRERGRLLLAAPAAFGLYELIVDNLEFLGFEVVHIEDDGYPFKYRSVGQRLSNLFRKVFLGDKEYKNKLRRQFIIDSQLRRVQQYDNYDYALVLRADFFREDILASIRNKTKHMISFHFDGLLMDPHVLDTVHLFDQFYVFDKDDLDRFPDYSLLYSPNFYFDYPLPAGSQRNSANANVYYVSTFHESRVDDLIALHRFLSLQFEKVEFVLVYHAEKEHLVPCYARENMRLQNKLVDFKEQLEGVATSDLILDLVLADHAGLSFRIFEGLSLKKKVVTTNARVRDADFYHPNNFHVFDGINFDELELFLETAYVDIADDIMQQYSFTNWIESKLLTPFSS